MTILHIETSTTVCSVAISNNGKLLYSIHDDNGMNHAEKLSPFVDKALKVLKENGLKLDAVAVSSGPGSYTGLRIGVSTAKGLCYGFGIPFISVDTLDILAIDVKKRREIESNALLCPMLDARRMEVYTKVLNFNFQSIEKITPKIIDENSFVDVLKENKIYFFGNGASKCKEVIQNENAIFIDDIQPLAENMIPLAEKKFKNKEFEDVAYFEPSYLKEFQATTSKKVF